MEVADGRILMHAGNPLTGITWTGKYPKMNYEISLDAMRVDGSDFFCGLTFPVGDDPCTFIVGGWGGGVIGLSSIDGSDASENETTRYQEFESGQWHKVRVRVTKGQNRSLARRQANGRRGNRGTSDFDPPRGRPITPPGHLLFCHDGRAAQHQGADA